MTILSETIENGRIIEQTHEYDIIAIDSREGDERQARAIDVYSTRGWRLIAVVPDGVMRTLYFERAVK